MAAGVKPAALITHEKISPKPLVASGCAAGRKARVTANRAKCEEQQKPARTRQAVKHAKHAPTKNGPSDTAAAVHKPASGSVTA